MKTWIIDTGPLVAFLDPRAAAHEAVGDALSAFRGQLVTTSAVVTEAMHFVGSHPEGPVRLAEFITESRLKVVAFTQPADLREAARRMTKYADLPMDYADATLVMLAEETGVLDILTLDRRGFTVFRTRDNQMLVNVIER